MQKTVSEFFHLLGLVFAFTFFTFWPITDNHSVYVFRENSLVSFLVCMFICCIAPFYWLGG